MLTPAELSRGLKRFLKIFQSNTGTGLSIKKLLYQRFEVIDSYPGSYFQINEIITLNFKQKLFDSLFRNYINYEAHPKIFKKLEWWERRNLSDLPLYVKHIKTGYIDKVIRWGENNASLFIKYKDSRHSSNNFLPVTEKEYNNFLSCTTEEEREYFWSLKVIK